MSGTTTIPLSPLSARPTTAPSAPTTPVSSTSPTPSTTQQTVQQPPPAPAQVQQALASVTQTLAGAPNSSSAANVNPPSQAAPASWIQKAKAFFALCNASIKFMITLLGIWAIYIAWQGLRLQRWTARNDYLQSCQSLASRSKGCNEAIGAGAQPPPSWKRDLASGLPSLLAAILGEMLSMHPVTASATVVCTAAAVILASIFFRPRMEPFHPVISHARLLHTGCWGLGFGRRWSTQLTETQHPWHSVLQELTTILRIIPQNHEPNWPVNTALIVPVDDDCTLPEGHGRPIGIFYESEDETYDSEHDNLGPDDAQITQNMSDTQDNIFNDHNRDSEQNHSSSADLKSRPTPSEAKDEKADSDVQLLPIDDRQDRHLGLLMKDVFFLEGIFRQALKSNSRDSTHRAVAHPLDVNERKDMLLQLATLEALMRILDCFLLDNYTASIPDHVQFVFRMLPATIGGLNRGDFRLDLMDVPSRFRRYMVADVLEELNERVCKGNGMLSQAGGRLEDQMLPALLDIYASSTFRPLSSAVWLGSSEETVADEVAEIPEPVPAGTATAFKTPVKSMLRKITQFWGQKL